MSFICWLVKGEEGPFLQSPALLPGAMHTNDSVTVGGRPNPTVELDAPPASFVTAFSLTGAESREVRCTRYLMTSSWPHMLCITQ